MMSQFLCTPDGDFALINNQLWLTDADEAILQEADGTPFTSISQVQQEVLQLLRNNLKFFLGEEPTNVSLGVPYFQQIFDKQTPQSTVEAILRQTISDTPGVKDIIGFNLTVNTATRQATVTFSVQTEDGPVTLTESLI